jgi:predicted phage terminase large subunit-like protein
LAGAGPKGVDRAEEVVAVGDQWTADEIIVEMANTGYALCQEFRDEQRGRLVGYKPLDDKETRFAVQMDKIESGQILIPREAEWLRAFRHELLAFPNGRDDDQVDSMAQFLDWIGRRPGRAKCERLLNGGRAAGRERPQDLRRPA